MVNLVTTRQGYRWLGFLKPWLGRTGVMSLVLLIGLASCAPVDPPAGGDLPPETAPEQPQPDSGVDADPGETEVETAPEAVVMAVKAAIASETGIAADQLSVTAASAETWPDGCLGLGGDDELCTQALVSGWQLTVEADDEDRTWTYRTDDTGDQLRLAAES